MGVTKATFVNFAVKEFFFGKKIPGRFFKSQSYLTDECNIQKVATVSGSGETSGKLQNEGYFYSSHCPWEALTDR